MAVQTANVYRCNVLLKSNLAAGRHRGEEIVVIAATAAGAISIAQQLYGSDFGSVLSPVVAMQGVYTSLTGTPA